MPPIETFAAFLVTTCIFACIPGPAMLYAAARTMAGGRRAGLMAALGIHMGGYAHVIAAAAGLSVLFRAVPPLYIAVKFAGAVYLIHLGIQMFRAESNADVAVAGVAMKTARRAFLESAAVETLNPKTALFFMAFLPQFVDRSAGAPIWLQLGAFGVLVNLIFSLADIVCVLLAARIAARLRRSGSAQRWMRRMGGSVLVGLGTHVALQSN
ncbi:LysE family translocator [Lichenifustis flavocetrariae]|uniref:LysE family translocator n=1 Tax=Lichenifustis flavocetrariae TaxID=2949735 RepID=A0AA41Z8J6_9HYPH|nr:LysE family translocator [Lichenifustis flavocetrariae]MCW6512488.1 LysE family translocator [Lichenifustis flavocetrariae]